VIANWTQVKKGVIGGNVLPPDCFNEYKLTHKWTGTFIA